MRRLGIGRVLACCRTEILSPYLVIPARWSALSLIAALYSPDEGWWRPLLGLHSSVWFCPTEELPLQRGVGLPHAAYLVFTEKLFKTLILAINHATIVTLSNR